MEGLPYVPPPPKYPDSAVGPVWHFSPILPSMNRRYNRDVIPLNPKLALPNVPAQSKTRTYTEDHPAGVLRDGWSEQVHPEGDNYYYQSERGLVTSLDPRDAQLSSCLTKAFDHLMSLLPSRYDVEVFIDLVFCIAPPQPTVTVYYYLVDHKSRQIFWAMDVDLKAIGLTEVLSKGHLKSLLTPEYWVHVDYYPVSDHFDRYFGDAEAELLGVLSHGAIDDKTAPGSTCPWAAAECIQYTSVIKDLRALDLKTTYRVAIIARLWSAVGRARHINSYGLPNARLDRLQGYTEFIPVQRSHTMTLCESATFFISIGILRRMSTLFNGRVVYHRHWDVFFQDIRSTWLKTSGVSGLILLCDVALMASKLNNIATSASASLGGASIFIGIFLHQKHPQWQLATGPDISQYVMSVEDYWQGLRPLSIVLALPQAVSIYSALLFHLGLLLIVTDRIAQAQEAVWTMAAMWVGILPLAASVMFFAPPKPESPKPELQNQNPGLLKSVLRKWKERPAREGNA